MKMKGEKEDRIALGKFGILALIVFGSWCLIFAAGAISAVVGSVIQ